MMLASYCNELMILQGVFMTAKEVIRKLKDAGWVEIRSKGSHHQFAHPDRPGTVTVPCHAGKDLSMLVVKSVEKQSGLSLRR